MFDSVKKLVGLSSNQTAVDLTGINLPWHQARCDAAAQMLLPLFHTRIFEQGYQNRIDYYEKLTGMVSDMIESLNQIALYHSKFQRTQIADPMLQPLQIVLSALKLLKENAVLSLKISEQGSSGLQLPAETLLKIRALDDSAADSEINLLHNIEEMLVSIAQPMQKSSENRKRQLDKANMDRYNRAFSELVQFYENR